MSVSAPDLTPTATPPEVAELARLTSALRELHVVEEYTTPGNMFAGTAWGCSTCESVGACPTLLVLDGMSVAETRNV